MGTKGLEQTPKTLGKCDLSVSAAQNQAQLADANVEKLAEALAALSPDERAKLLGLLVK